MLKIYLTDLSAYNKGSFVGQWVDLPCYDLDSKLQDVLKEGEQICLNKYGYYEEHEEYLITDYEWDDVFLFSIKGHCNIVSLNDDLILLDGLENYDIHTVKFLLDDGIVTNIQEALEKVDDVWVYESSSLEEFGMNVIAETYGLDIIPHYLQNYIDFKAYANDLILCGEFVQTEHGFYSYIH